MPRATFEKIHFPTDERGLVIEPLGPDLIPQQRNIHVAITRPGGIRGNHYHQHSTEICTLIGAALVRLREDGIIRDIEVPEGQAYRFTFPPRVSHAVQNSGTKPLLIMAFSSAVFDPAHPDVVRDELIGGMSYTSP